MTPAQRAYEPAASDARALRRLSTELTRVAGGQVDAEGVGTYADAPLNRGDKGTRADQVLVAGSREVLDRAIAEMVRRGYSVLGVREDDGEWWAWLAGGEEAKREEAAQRRRPSGRDATARGRGHDGARGEGHGFHGERASARGGAEGRGPTHADDHATKRGAAEGLTASCVTRLRPPMRPHAGPGPPGFRASAVTPYAVASSDPVDALCGFVWGGVGDG